VQLRGEEMGRKALDLTGQRFNRLIAVRISKEKSDNHHTFWECICDCGNTIIVRKDSLLSGHAQSCGCLLSERYELGYKRSKGMSNTRIYSIYLAMKYRCCDSNAKAYPLYEGRGIKVCEEWLGDKGFFRFHSWAMQNGYSEDLMIDRINNDGDYDPSNCRWATVKEQGRNRRTNIIIDYMGKKQCLLDWCNELGISRSAVSKRLKNNPFILPDELFKKGR
jgi:hypothetical protein